MAKEWVLNTSANRFQLNFKRNVGATSENIRKCSPNSLEEWKNYYYENVKSKEHIDNLGEKLYDKIKNVIKKEVEEITQEDCINFMHNLVINRVYEGYTSEIAVVKELLENELGVEIKEASDEWDRLFNVDFYIQINDQYIGLQIKPAGFDSVFQIQKEKRQQLETHKKFTNKYGGNVFYVYSEKKEGKKVISNPDVIGKIKEEINRLS